MHGRHLEDMHSQLEGLHVQLIRGALSCIHVINTVLPVVKQEFAHAILLLDAPTVRFLLMLRMLKGTISLAAIDIT